MDKTSKLGKNLSFEGLGGPKLEKNLSFASSDTPKKLNVRMLKTQKKLKKKLDLSKAQAKIMVKSSKLKKNSTPVLVSSAMTSTSFEFGVAQWQDSPT